MKPLSSAKRHVLRRVLEGATLYLPRGGVRAFRLEAKGDRDSTYVAQATIEDLVNRGLISQVVGEDRWVLTAAGVEEAGA